MAALGFVTAAAAGVVVAWYERTRVARTERRTSCRGNGGCISTIRGWLLRPWRKMLTYGVYT
jgi:hypothetical protein